MPARQGGPTAADDDMSRQQAGGGGAAGGGMIPPEVAGAGAAEVAGAATVTGGRPGPETASVVRSSGIMAVGTLASRATGFLRTLVLAYALGVTAVANAYYNANTLPNAVYDLMLGGILTSIVVPLLVNAAKRDADGGEAYDQRIFTLTTISLLALTVVATLAATLLVALYASALPAPTRHLTVIFAYFFIPQIFFYGVSSLAGGVLNARGRFAAPMWTPVINNIVVIAVLLLFLVTGGLGDGTAASLGTGEIQLLGFGTTLGIITQTAALIPALRRAGFRWRPRFDFRRDEVAEIRRMAAPLFGYIATTQVSLLVVQNVANAASAHASYDGFSTYNYAFQLFQMPYAVIGISVITALLPRISAHAAARRPDHVRADFSAGLRLSSVIVVPSALVLAVLGPDLAEVFLAHGATSVASARYMGEVFAVLCLGLVPYTVFQLQLRVFYALHDSRTPALIGVVTMIVNVGANYAALTLLPPGQVVAGLGFAFGLGNLAGSALAWRLLSRRLGGMDGRVIGGCLLRAHAAAVPPALLALALSLAAATILPGGPLGALVTVTLAGAAALLLYLFLARVFRVSELTDLLGTVTARLRR